MLGNILSTRLSWQTVMVGIPTVCRLLVYTVYGQWQVQQVWYLALSRGTGKVLDAQKLLLWKKFVSFFHYIFWQYIYSPDICLKNRRRNIQQIFRQGEGQWEYVADSQFFCLFCLLFVLPLCDWVPMLGQIIPSWTNLTGCPILIHFMSH